MQRKFLCALLIAGVAGCQTTDPYTGESKTSNTAKSAGIGALMGAVAGAAINHDNRGNGALLGAALGAAAGGAYGHHRDKQEEQLRQQMAGTGVDVQREGDNLKLVMPGNVTFNTGRAEIQADFYDTLNTVAQSLKDYPETTVKVSGHTDSTGDAMKNQVLSEQRAASVVRYLQSQGVAAQRLQSVGYGARYPVADNGTEAGRQSNRRVELEVLSPPEAAQ